MNIFNKDQPFQFGESRFLNGGRYGPVKQEHLDITIVLEGESTCIIDGQEIHCSAGQAVFAYTQDHYEMLFPKGRRHVVLWCHTGELALPKESKAYLESVPNLLLSSELMITLVNEGKALGYGNSISLCELRNALGEALFKEYFYKANLEMEDQIYPPAISKAKRYIESHFTEPCELNEIAAHAGLNPRYLIRLFKQHMGWTPIRYLWHLRAEKGVGLLHQSSLSLSQIAYQCGFQSPHHFSRHIKECYGVPPSKLRAETKNRDPHEFNKSITQVNF